MTADMGPIFNAVVHEHGGKNAFSATQLEIARVFASALAEGKVEPGAIAAWTGLLPPKQEAAPYDLSRLDNRELELLNWLTAKACGEVAARPKRHKRSARQHSADDLALVLDDHERRWRAAKARKKPELDILAVRGRIAELCGWLVSMRDLCGPEIAEAVGRMPSSAPTEAAGAFSPDAAVVQPGTGSGASTGNVVPLPRKSPPSVHDQPGSLAVDRPSYHDHLRGMSHNPYGGNDPYPYPR